MKYPEKLRIGDREYRVRFVKSIRGCKKRIGQGAIVGLYDPTRVEILIRKGQSDDEVLKTLLHEVVHAIEYEYEIKISHSGVYKFEEALFDFICANFVKP